jgi:hypothetical protein
MGESISGSRLSEVEDRTVLLVLTCQEPMIADAITVTYLDNNGEQRDGDGDGELHSSLVASEQGKRSEEIGRNRSSKSKDKRTTSIDYEKKNGDSIERFREGGAKWRLKIWKQCVVQNVQDATCELHPP